jgi:uncharacterized protein with HEPN domain
VPSEKPARGLEDIIENAPTVLRYTAGMDFAAFENDHKTSDAVERCLERISEAAAKLGDLAPVLVSGQPWGEIRALGNACAMNTTPFDRIGSGTSSRTICPHYV